MTKYVGTYHEEGQTKVITILSGIKKLSMLSSDVAEELWESTDHADLQFCIGVFSVFLEA